MDGLSSDGHHYIAVSGNSIFVMFRTFNTPMTRMRSHEVFVDDCRPGETRDELAAPGWFGQALFHKAVGPRETPTAEQCLSPLVCSFADGQPYLKLV